jgi:hypothetical protein
MTTQDNNASPPVVAEGQSIDTLAVVKAAQEYLVDVVRSFGDVRCAAYISTWHNPEKIHHSIGAALARSASPAQQVGEMNLNDSVEFELTEFGAKVWNHRYASLNLPRDLRPASKRAGDRVREQLWSVMQTFGPHIGLGKEIPFARNVVSTALAANQQAQQGGHITVAELIRMIPNGWHLVPLESRSKMDDAGLLALPDNCTYDDAEKCFRAMVLAAPLPEEFDMPAAPHPVSDSGAAPAAVAPKRISFAKAGRDCMSEDACIAAGINFAAYERGVADAIEACERITALAIQAQAQPVGDADQVVRNAKLRDEVATMYQLLNDGEWAEHIATTPDGQCLETAITALIGKANQVSQAQPSESVLLEGFAITAEEFAKVYEALGLDPEEYEGAGPVVEAIEALKAAVQPVNADMLQRFASWITINRPEHYKDHACARCVPGGEIVKEGFSCVLHEALDVIGGVLPVNADTERDAWISVSERLPEDDGRYLITAERFSDGPCIDMVWYRRGTREFDALHVTHWMPLPAAPAKAGKGGDANG